MRIVEKYSHLNGLEFLLVHKPIFWEEIKEVVKSVDAGACKTKISEEKNKQGKLLYNPAEMNMLFKKYLEPKGWVQNKESYWVTKDEKLIRKTLTMDPDDQKQEIKEAGYSPIFSYKQTDFVKDRIAVEVQFGFVSYDLFVKHLAFYLRDQIDVGIEILPMKALQSHIGSGISYYEGELYNVIRQGRGVPAVPLVIVGIDD